MNVRLCVNDIKDFALKLISNIVDISIIYDFIIFLWVALVGPFQYEHIKFHGTTLGADSIYRPVVVLLLLLCIRWLLCRKFANFLKLWPFDRPECYLFLFLVVYLGIILPVIFYKYYSFEWKFPHDLAVLNQVFYNTLHGSPFHDTIFIYHKLKIFNYLGDHFEPIICLLLPFYYLNQDTSSLIIIQSITITLSAVPIYLISKNKLKNAWIALLVVVLYLTHPLVTSLHFVAFRPIIIAVPFLLFSFYFIQVGKIRRSIMFLLLAALCQESVFIASFGMGIYLLFRKEIKGHLKLGFIIMIISICSLYFIVFKLIPHFSDGGFIPFNQFGRGDYGSLGAAFTNILRRVMTYSNPETNRYIAGIIKDLGFIPLLSPVILISLPFFLQIYMSGIGEEFWHASLIIPFLFISLIYGVYNLLRISKKFLIPVILILMAFEAQYGFKDFQDKIIKPFSQNKRYISIKPENYRYFKEAKDIVPVNGSLLTNVSLLPNLSARKEIYPLFCLGRKEKINIDWILCYQSFGQEIAHQSFLEEKLELLKCKNKYITLYDKGGFYVMAKVKEERLGIEWSFQNLDDLNVWKFDPCNVKYDRKIGKNGLEVDIYFDGCSIEDEFARIRYDKDIVDIKKYPYLNLDYMIEDPNVQTIEVVAGIDFNNDGRDDQIIKAMIDNKVSDIYKVNLLDIVKDLAPNGQKYDMVFLELYLHKIWHADCSKFPNKRRYKFQINRLYMSNYIFSE